MRIGIDARLYGITGIGRYVKNLILELEKQDQENEYVIFFQKKNFDWYPSANPRFHKVETDFPYYSFAEQLFFPLKIWQAKVDLMHFVNFNIPLLYQGKFIITIHDLIYEEHSTFGMSVRNYYYYQLKRLVAWFMLRWSVGRAKKIIVPSQSTKDDLVKTLKVNPQKVVVTYEGIDEGFKGLEARSKELVDDKILREYSIKKPYLLYVSTMYPYKNHQKLIEAFEFLIKEPQFDNLQLVLVGKKDFFWEKLFVGVRRKGLGDRIMFPLNDKDGDYLTDEKLVVLFKNASLYILPSLKEGFGLTILEAWASGVPVVCSDIAVLREVGGDAVFHFNPQDLLDIKTKLVELLVDQSLQDQLVAKGKERLNQFSWAKMANQTREIYQSHFDTPTYQSEKKS